MKRILAFVLGLGVLAAVSWAASPAFAKGEGMLVEGRTLIFGLGLTEPIELRGSLSAALLGEAPGSTPVDTGSKDFSAFAVAAGLVPTDIGYVGETPKGDLGPRYLVTTTVTDVYPPSTISQEFYPYAAAGPVFFDAAGQKGIFGNELFPGWWYAPASILAILQSHGLPVTAPSAPAPGAHPAPGPVPTSSSSRVWIAVAVIAALTLLLIAAALAGRPRSMRTPA